MTYLIILTQYLSFNHKKFSFESNPFDLAYLT